jgi:hypothetical protein
MRLNIAILVSSLTLSVLGTVTPQAWYRLGEGGIGVNNYPLDSSVNGHTLNSAWGTGVSVIALGAVAQSTTSYYFNGIESGFWGTYTSSLDNIGIECWARTSSSQANKTLFNTGASGLQLVYDNGFRAAIQGVAWIGGTYVASTGAWIHVALVRTNGVNIFYVEGKPFASSGTVPGATYVLHLGIEPGGSGMFEGNIDEARVFTFNSGEFDPRDLLYYIWIPIYGLRVDGTDIKVNDKVLCIQHY